MTLCPRFTTNSKELLRDGQHFADCVSPSGAQAAAIMLNKGTITRQAVSDEERDLVRAELRS